ncbi:MAG: crossover junction endodeoxyribonuclease RuvC [Puniceicoccales bacterium]|jgi:crossover junction endodeoxyribonuclease RuvC|nr:crossover junction endodeoxyribonuclease RuvC [Puniceicoccales bacterium]
MNRFKSAGQIRNNQYFQGMGSRSLRRMWTEKLSSASGNIPSGKHQRITSAPTMQTFRGVAIGIDTSLRGTGIAIVNFSAATPKLVFSTRITCPPKLSFPQCIEKIFAEMTAVVNNFQIDSAALEQTTYVQNYKISHILGAAKGAVIVALTSKNLAISEYPPLRIKQSVTGVGRASKEQVRRTICNILNIQHEISYDESDAIAIALCHAWTKKHAALNNF